MSAVHAGLHQMPMDDYINDPAPVPSLNASTAHTLLTESPLHAWTNHPRLNPAYERDDSTRLSLGTIAHAILVEGDESRIVVIDAKDYKTNAAKEARDAAFAERKLPILPDALSTVRKMVEVAVNKLFASEFCEAWMEALPEQTLLWEERGTWFRSRPDKLTPNGRLYFDYKTTAGSAHPAKFSKGPVINYGYDLQAALGMRGVKRLLATDQCTVVFVVQEIKEPYAVSLVSLSPQFMGIASERLELAIHKWTQCVKSNVWPSYPERVAYVEPPSYYGMDSLDDLEEGA